MNDQGLIMKAARLSQAAPREWEEFVTEIKAHVERCRDDLVRAPGTAINMAQGRAQAVHYLSELFTNAAKTANRITDRRT